MVGPIHFIVEAGSFIGNSANMWAKFARKHDATVLCIDTWEGDVNMCRLYFVNAIPMLDPSLIHLFMNILAYNRGAATIQGAHEHNVRQVALIRQFYSKHH